MDKCKCGCDTFRFKPTDPNDQTYMKSCRNCGHNLADHLAVTRSKQAE